MNRQELRKRIFAQATDAQARVLTEDSHYGAPYSFWRNALDYGLITEAEYDFVESNYPSNLWHYRGD